MDCIKYHPKPKTGSISVSKVITGSPLDEAYFHVWLVGQMQYPTIVDGWVKQGETITFRNLKFDTYLVKEGEYDYETDTTIPPVGYTAVANDPIVLTRGTRNQSVTVVNQPMTAIKYGALYNWYAASKNGGTGVGSIAPNGWHVPSDVEWETLVTELGGSTIAGAKLKEVGIEHWDSTNAEATNESGFNARGSSYRYIDGSFNGLKYSAIFWSSTELSTYAWKRTLYRTNSGVGSTVGRYYDPKVMGESIRLIKDDSIDTGIVTDIDGNVYPTVKIGDQVWMAANLAVTKFNDGTPITNVTSNTEWAELTTPAYCWYDNDINNK